MYKNVGKSIKTLVKVLVVIGIVIWVLVALIGIGACVIGAIASEGEMSIAALLVAVLAVIGAGIMIFLTWISGFTMYAYGEITENTAKMVENQNKLLAQLKTATEQLKNQPAPIIIPAAPATSAASVAHDAPVAPAAPVEPAAPVAPAAPTGPLAPLPPLPEESAE